MSDEIKSKQDTPRLDLPVMGQLKCRNGHTFTVEPFPKIFISGWENATPVTSTYICPDCGVRVHKSG